MELKKHFNEIIIHTGQHYDYGMSDIFFEELSIPKPQYNLQMGGGTHGAQTGAMLAGIEEILLKEKPDIVLVYGDTNSTLAGALAAAKLHIPIAHVEAGLRSFNRKMPEEVNRVLTDHISSWLFPTSSTSIDNLKKEGVQQGVYDVGDIMYDAILMHSQRAKGISKILETHSLTANNYYLATVHRAENTDSPERLNNIIQAFGEINTQIVLPLHPRTKKQLKAFNFSFPENVIKIEPVGYLDMVQLMQNAVGVLTDSGGIQKEAYYLNKPCITLRDETEWVETVEVGWNKIVGTSVEKILKAFEDSKEVTTLDHPNLYGDGKTAEKITNKLLNN
ncbi:UDP-N-acetylglucosamine 2-epimerase [marine bacterium AO1-C]|nr:UDP-N-acetylglucosamine 2-epimerase [marine bacterium AO1-C]